MATLMSPSSSTVIEKPYHQNHPTQHHTHQQRKPTRKADTLFGGNTNRHNSRSSHKDMSNIVIPPRAVDVNFNSNSSNSHKDKGKKKTNGKHSKSAGGSETTRKKKSSSGNHKDISTPPSSSSTDDNSTAVINENLKNLLLNSPPSLPNGKVPTFGLTNNANIVKAAADALLTPGSVAMDKYAGSSFQNEPKAVTLPRPSFLRK